MHISILKCFEKEYAFMELIEKHRLLPLKNWVMSHLSCSWHPRCVSFLEHLFFFYEDVLFDFLEFSDKGHNRVPLFENFRVLRLKKWTCFIIFVFFDHFWNVSLYCVNDVRQSTYSTLNKWIIVQNWEHFWGVFSWKIQCWCDFGVYGSFVK